MFMRLAALAPVGVLALAGCSVSAAPEGSEADPGAATQSTAAIVVVERALGPGDVARGEVIARFARATRAGGEELRIAGVRAIPAIGSCAPSDELDVATRPVELADVGVVTFESTGSRVALVPRKVPDPAGVISGVIYSARLAEADAPAGRTEIRVTGGELEGVSATAFAPNDVTGLRADPSEGGLSVAWDRGDDARDVMVIDVSARGRGAVRCAFVDAGQAVVPSAWVSASDTGSLTLHRVRQRPFRARGLDAAELRFDFSRSTTFGR